MEQKPKVNITEKGPWDIFPAEDHERKPSYIQTDS